jgi:acetyltransferase-like isoleucine patch superfamily enzyme
MMKKLAIFLFRTVRFLNYKISASLSSLVTNGLLYLNDVEFDKVNSNGIPLILVSRGGAASVGPNFTMNNRESSNPIGRFNRCTLFVGPKGKLIIGKNVGMSSSSIVCHQSIEIMDNVKIGGNVVIYDTDFHSLSSSDRNNREMDLLHVKSAGVKIEKNVFIGAHSSILKGVTIGEGSIIGACSVVTKNIPKGEIWAGNPARFIRNIAENV